MVWSSSQSGGAVVACIVGGSSRGLWLDGARSKAVSALSLCFDPGSLMYVGGRGSFQSLGGGYLPRPIRKFDRSRPSTKRRRNRTWEQTARNTRGRGSDGRDVAAVREREESHSGEVGAPKCGRGGWCFGAQVSIDRLVIDSRGARDQRGGGKKRRLDRQWVDSE